jgi:hypothetical protein
MGGYVLLVVDDQGDLMGIPFTSAERARDWEDKNERRLGEVYGLVRVVTRAEALRVSR